MDKDINLSNIQEQFYTACRQGNALYIKQLLDHEYGYAIQIDDNDYKPLKLIESHANTVLEYVLLKRVTTEGRIQHGNYYIDANTYYWKLNKENQKNEQLALSMLINGNENLNVIYEQLKTPDFLTKLSTLKYGQNIFDFDFTYTNSYKKFIIDYIKQGHALSKKSVLDIQLLEDKEFIKEISKYHSNIFYLIQDMYCDEIEIMKNIAVNDESAFRDMKTKVRNEISKDIHNALKIIEINTNNYMYIHQDSQKNEEIIEKVLSIKPSLYEHFLQSIKNNVMQTLNYVTKYNIDVKFLSDTAKESKQIAKVMVEKNGNNLKYFTLFEEDKNLIEIALKTSKKLSLLPKQDRSIEKVRDIVIQATCEENSYNMHYLPKELKEDPAFILEVVQKNVFFKEDIYALVNDYGYHKNNYEIIKKCIEIHSDLYGRFFNFKEDYEIIHIYIEKMKKEMNGIYSTNLLPQKIKAEASMNKVAIDKYVLNKTLEKKSHTWAKSEGVKEKRIKI